MKKYDMSNRMHYTVELVTEICEKIATSSKGVKHILDSHPNFPSHETFYQWLKIHKEFAEMYAKAKRDQVEILVEEIIEIADDKSEDKYIDEDGRVRHNAVAHARNRLQIDSRKWLAAKLAPRIYGERIEHDVTSNVNTEDLQRRKEALDEKNKKEY